MTDLENWQACKHPEKETLLGHYCRLEPLDPIKHGDQLFTASMAPNKEERFRYLPDEPQNRNDFEDWLTLKSASIDPLFYAVIDLTTETCEGRQTLMRITPQHGVIEIGNILWGPKIARTRVATEAMFLFASLVFNQLGYRRFEWKCDALNKPSRAAAERFGFVYEGTFRQHRVVKGKNRDTAWFAMTDDQWPDINDSFSKWLDKNNFDELEHQKTRLRDIQDTVIKV